MRTKAFLAAFAFALAACGGGGEEAATEGGAETDAPASSVDPATAATITGTVKLEGTPPANEKVDMSAEKACADKHSTPPTKHTVVANSNGTLRNVFVYVKDGLPSGTYPAKDSPVLDQDGCEYKPRVLGVVAGQDLTIKNSDGLLHNINAKPTTNRGFNIGQPTNMETKKQFTQREVMIPVTCEVHGWMEGFIGVVDHPFFAVTGEDGSFKIEGLPPGTYTIETWHEKYGTKTMSVTVAASESKAADFTYNAAAVAKAPLGKPFDPHTHARSGAAASH